VNGPAKLLYEVTDASRASSWSFGGRRRVISFTGSKALRCRSSLQPIRLAQHRSKRHDAEHQGRSQIIHAISFKDVNAQLERGRPFFIDIVEQGIALYEADGYEFAQPRNLPPEDARVEAKKHFEEWFPSAQTFLQNAKDNTDRERPKEAVFLMHQATERLYHCTLLVMSLYSPKSHRLNFLRSQCEQIAPALAEAWPRDDKFSRRCFELLRLAYVNSRYSPLCRTRHNFDYAERPTMPSGRANALLSNNFAVIGSA